MSDDKTNLSLKDKLKEDFRITFSGVSKFLTVTAVIFGIVVGIHEFTDVSYSNAWILLIVMGAYFAALVAVSSIMGWARHHGTKKLKELIHTYKNAKKYEEENKKLREEVADLKGYKTRILKIKQAIDAYESRPLPKPKKRRLRALAAKRRRARK